MQDIAQGGKFVVFQYVISIIVLTFMRPSKVHYIKSTENAAKKGLKFTLITAFLGWWGIPWGPIRSVQAIRTNAKGGKDITSEVIARLGQKTS
jgi:hypothetical protein